MTRRAARREEESEEDEDEVEALGVANAMEKALASSKAEGGGDEDEEEEDEDAAMPEDPQEMAAVDRQLAAMLRLRMEQRQAKKEQTQQSIHFKQRVIDILDALARRSSPPPSLLLLPLPLLKLLSTMGARPSDRPLLERTTGLLRNRLAKLTIRGPWPHTVAANPPLRGAHRIIKPRREDESGRCDGCRAV